MADLDLTELASARGGSGTLPEPASAADAWSRIESFFATHLH